MNKNIIITVIIVLVLIALGAGFWLWQSSQSRETAPTGLESITPATEVPASDDTASINQDIEALDTGDLNAEFKEVDTDLGNL